MKKFAATTFVMMILLSLSGCDFYNVFESVSDYLIEEDGSQYLILPESGKKVSISQHFNEYVDDIELELLKEAELKINDESSRYSEEAGFGVREDEGCLCLYAEVIIDSNMSKYENPIGGCDIGHEHKFFIEPITNKNKEGVTMENIISAVILGVVAVVCFMFSFFQFHEKGFLFNNAYLYASKQERETMDKKPYYRQSGIIFLLIGILFSINAVDTILETGWLLYLVIAIGVAALVYAVVSSVLIDKNKK